MSGSLVSNQVTRGIAQKLPSTQYLHRELFTFDGRVQVTSLNIPPHVTLARSLIADFLYKRLETTVLCRHAHKPEVMKYNTVGVWEARSYV